ncbi:MAG: hypothetical protein QNJ51_17285 [Calothrix sp. MO_167.B12]|nr:hypothetical protein [Calothrix sp. MO_167.B12]
MHRASLKKTRVNPCFLKAEFCQFGKKRQVSNKAAGVEEWERTDEISGVSPVNPEVGVVAFQKSLCENTLYSHGLKPLPKGGIAADHKDRAASGAHNFRSRSKLRTVSSIQGHYTNNRATNLVSFT